jgi:hypothetical protein
VFVIKLFSIEYHHFSLNLFKLSNTAFEALGLNQFLDNSLARIFLSISSYFALSLGIHFARAIASFHSFIISSLFLLLLIESFIFSHASLYQCQIFQFIEQSVIVFLL